MVRVGLVGVYQGLVGGCMDLVEDCMGLVEGCQGLAEDWMRAMEEAKDKNHLQCLSLGTAGVKETATHSVSCETWQIVSLLIKSQARQFALHLLSWQSQRQAIVSHFWSGCQSCPLSRPCEPGIARLQLAAVKTELDAQVKY